MDASHKIDMREVTRLTREGKLAEAVRLLQGFEPGAAPHPAGHDVGESLARTHRLFSGRLGGLSEDAAAGIALFRSKAPPVPEGARFETRTFVNEGGARTYKVYVPSDPGARLPVVVMLHGCTQDPDDFATGTRMNEIAEAQKFLVVYPAQPQSANMQKCWNWFNASEQRRGGGEPSSIAGIAREVVAEYSGDPARVYVAGLSAGGAAAANLAATYPDVFAAVGVHSGLACGAARDMGSAFAAMNGGAAVARRRGPMVPTIVFHGDADKTVNAVNGDQVIAQLGSGLVETADEGRSAAGMGYTRRRYADAAGSDIAEHWTLHGAGHAWSGGSPNGSFTDPRGPDASREMARFFLSRQKQ
jgi:poly(hydroxyalkanoate) depolymerase family esterase